MTNENCNITDKQMEDLGFRKSKHYKSKKNGVSSYHWNYKKELGFYK